MGLASQLQQFQQQQAGGATSTGVQPQGSYNQGATPQYQQQPHQGQSQMAQFPQQSAQYPQQGFQPQQQQQQHQQYPQQNFQPQQNWQQQPGQGQYPQIQQNWQQQQQPAAAPAPNQQYHGYVTNKLQQMVTTNRLQAFYPPQRLQQVVEKVLRVDLRAIGQKWNMPMELAFDLASLALYDIVIYADDSTSMQYAEGGERIRDLKTILARVSEVATLFDDDGITIRWMNANLEGNNVRDSASACSIVDKIKFNGMTPLGTNMDAKIIKPLFVGPVQRKNLLKPILVITITDGEPTGEKEGKIVQVIKDAKALAMNSTYGPGSIAFEFAQVGKDQAAQAFLARLDKHPEVGKMIDATSYYELEAEEYKRKGINLTPDVWLVKLMVGAVDPTFDEQD